MAYSPLATDGYSALCDYCGETASVHRGLPNGWTENLCDCCYGHEDTESERD